MKSINGVMLSKMITNASKLLDINRDRIDALNVFPVPDGDTGTNMSLTVKSAVKELKAVKSHTMQEVCEAVTRGALRGARGNSGVITSQVFRGVCSTLSKSQQDVDVKTFVKSMKTATEIAYGAVSKPKEGTMLTVCRMMSEAATSSKAKSFEDLFVDVIRKGEEALELTPELLPVLKKAGVVDSGGMGLLTIFKGMQKAILGEEVEGTEEEIVEQQEEKAVEHADILNLGVIEFGYCTEFFITNIKKKTTLAAIDKLREYLMTIGDSVIVVGDLEFVKVHVHTNQPGRALSHALELGEIDKVKIENMLEQNRELMKKYQAEKKEMGMLSICSGKGFETIFKDIAVDRVIEGGQTMNPSADDIASAICRINADNVFVFPNNKNIILAAEQSKQLVEGKNIHVIPTKNVPQGILAALSFNPEESPSVNKINMLHAIDNVAAGQVTYAVRNTKVDGFTLSKGDIIGLNDKKILAKSNDIGECTLNLIEKLANESHSVVNLYFGADIKEEDAEVICNKVREKFPELDVELFFGGQAVYYFVVSLE
ncbi:MAG: DAK2 domain-containing protein [Clostridia bacterium]|nr:DAK2 domain-containing protein [Clostridia bacterium]